MLNVFASWCDPCQAEAPILAKEQPILAKHNATLVGVTYEDLSTASQQFAKRYHIDYPGAARRDRELRAVVRRHGRAGNVRDQPQGEDPGAPALPGHHEWLDQTLPRILDEKS